MVHTDRVAMLVGGDHGVGVIVDEGHAGQVLTEQDLQIFLRVGEVLGVPPSPPEVAPFGIEVIEHGICVWLLGCCEHSQLVAGT